MKYNVGIPLMWIFHYLLKNESLRPLVLLLFYLLSPQTHGKNEDFH